MVGGLKKAEMVKKTLYFGTIEELINGMKRERAPKNLITRSSNHELAHYKKATELGYDPFCQLDIKKYFFGLFRKINVFVRLPRSIDSKDLIEIYLAPKNPSKGDYAGARALGWRPER